MFLHVADGAMYPCGGDSCHHCERSDVPVYGFDGEIVNPDLAKNPALAADEPQVSELCASCILGGNVRKSAYRIREITPIVTRWAADPVRAIEEYHRTPDIPLLMQRYDWPMCCGGWCEFVGTPDTRDVSRQVPHGFRYWERGPVEWHFRYELLPESLREVSLFRCALCGGGWFVWQPT
ncbi:MAG: hypothetical protein U0804_16650 [Gemmataceae bacterium]